METFDKNLGEQGQAGKSPAKSDALLNAAKVIIIIAQIVFIFAMVMVGIGLAAISFLGTERQELLAKIFEAGAPAEAAWAIGFIMILIMVLLGLGHRFMSKLLQIVKSVGNGQPFQPENAQHLKQMGWISVAAQVMILPISAIGIWLSKFSDEPDGIHIDGGISLGAILLTLILFILARVFDHGTRLEADMEGTV